MPGNPLVFLLFLFFYATKDGKSDTIRAEGCELPVKHISHTEVKGW